jgi:chromosomal replication initiator protein
MSEREPARTFEASLESDDSLISKWEKCLELITGQVSSQGFRTWISPIIPVGFVDNQLILRVPSQFFFEWIESNYANIIKNAVSKIFGLNIHIDYLIASTKNQKPEKINLEPKKANTSLPEQTESQKEDFFGLDSRFWFDNYYCKKDNELAWKAAKAVANQPGKTDYNPLFIHGASGCGKTHLLMAVGNHILKNRKRKKIRYMTSETFLNEYIYALQNRKLDEYNKNIKQLDVLLLDDIQFLCNKKKSQEALFYLLSEMERERKQIVITSSQSPAHLSGFNSYLTSFFQKGLIIDLVAPSYETKLIWIENYAQNNNLDLLPELKEFLASSFLNGLHQLRGAMVRIVAHSSLLGEHVSIVLAKRLLAQIDAEWAKRNEHFTHTQPLKIDKIIKTVSKYFKISPDVLVGFSRRREVSIARQIAIFLARELSGETLKVIGYNFNDRHYTAILHSFNKVKENLKNNPAMMKMISDIKNLLEDEL